MKPKDLKEHDERSAGARFFSSRYSLFILIVLIVLVGRGTYGAYKKFERSGLVEKRAESELQELKEREANLMESIENLETEDGRESEVRKKFGLVKPGEKMIVLVGDEVPTDDLNIEKKGIWERFLDLFR